MADERYCEFTEANPKVWVQSLYEVSTTAKQRLGAKRTLGDGREFVYVKLGANAVAGQVLQTRVPVIANEANMAVTANANIGDRSIAFTMGDSTLANTANALAEGFVHVNTGGGNGHAYKIKNHAAIAANANGTLYLYDKLRANLASSTSKVTITPSKYSGVLQAVANLTGAPVGVTTFAANVNEYVWLQTKGEAAVEVEGTVVAGDVVICSSSVAGVVGPAANGGEMYFQVGICVANNANDHWSLVDLKL